MDSVNDNPLLLLISFDGFRYDLLNKAIVPHIWKFAQEGELTRIFVIFVHFARKILK